MSEPLIPLTTDPALLAEAVAWQQECGVFDVLSPQPIDAFRHKPAPAPTPQATETPASRRAATPAGPAGAPAGAPVSQPSGQPSGQAATQPVSPASAPPARNTNQHARRGLEAADDIAEAERLAAACTTLAELRDAIEAFDGCLLKETASSTVFADGVEDTDILIIGEAPGADEDRQGKPFVGRSGQMLDTMLSYIGLNRDEHFRITNIVFWRPPGNRKPNAGEVALCWPFSRRHIELIQPKVILAVGGLAAQTLVEPGLRITRERGKWKSFDSQGRAIPVLPTLHPAYLLRQPVNKREAWTDLLILRQFLSENP